MHDFLYVKDGWSYIQVFFSEILYIEANDKYSSLVTNTKKHLILQPLNNIEKSLPSNLFCRVHRSYIVSLLHTKCFDNNTVSVGDRTLPIGKLYKGALPGRVVIFNSTPQHVILSDFDLLKLFKKVGPN
jgi:hypothetical protein